MCNSNDVGELVELRSADVALSQNEIGDNVATAEDPVTFLDELEADCAEDIEESIIAGPVSDEVEAENADDLDECIVEDAVAEVVSVEDEGESWPLDKNAVNLLEHL